ncbi:MAG TPA: histidine phosphatase family protein [Solirubrobacteraceae bacterium]|nr:histidine phosphatase family protein [Solirubrobacteraceae bacterium]
MADRIFIVRHGETEWSANGRHTSVTDLPLTTNGRTQAEIAAEKVMGEQFALVLCSPRLRARQTAEIAGFGETAERCDDIVEWDYGKYEGLTSTEIWERHDPDWNLWRDGCPGGESPAEVGARVDRVLQRFATVDGDGLVFAHGHILRVLTARWCEMEVAAGAHFKLATAAIGVLGHERATTTIDRWSA